MERTFELDISTKAVIVHAKHKRQKRNWIILVAGVSQYSTEYGFHIDRYASYHIEENREYIDILPSGWGYTYEYDFYEATDKEKQLIMDIIKKKGYKYIRTLNKMVDYKNGGEFK